MDTRVMITIPKSKHLLTKLKVNQYISVYEIQYIRVYEIQYISVYEILSTVQISMQLTVQPNGPFISCHCCEHIVQWSQCPMVPRSQCPKVTRSKGPTVLYKSCNKSNMYSVVWHEKYSVSWKENCTIVAPVRKRNGANLMNCKEDPKVSLKVVFTLERKKNRFEQEKK